MKLIKTFFLLVALFFATGVFAQNGTIRGTVIEDSNGEPFPFANVVVLGTTTGTATDFDGAFELSLAPGTYDIEISFLSFETITITGIEVQTNEVALFDIIRMKPESELLSEVVVTAAQVPAMATVPMMISSPTLNV